MTKPEFYEVNGCTDFVPATINETYADGIGVTVHSTTHPFRIAVKQVYQFLKPHEPAKVDVPEFMDGYFRYCKDRGMSLFEAMEYAQNKEADWLTENEEVFSKAFFDGYEVKQEKEYVVTDGNKLYLKEFDELNAVIIIDDVVGSTDYAKRYSDKAEAQKAAAELGWKVVEVE